MTQIFKSFRSIVQNIEKPVIGTIAHGSMQQCTKRFKKWIVKHFPSIVL